MSRTSFSTRPLFSTRFSSWSLLLLGPGGDPSRRCQRDGSWRTDKTYICQGVKWRYLYRAVDSAGATVDFWLSAERDAAAAKRFFQKALQAPGHPRPRVITVDGKPSYPKEIAELKQERTLGRRCRRRTSPYLNNMVEQDHRAIKRRVHASQGFRSFDGAWRTIQGYEAVHMILKGQVRWLPKEDVRGQIQFIRQTLGLKIMDARKRGESVRISRRIVFATQPFIRPARA